MMFSDYANREKMTVCIQIKSNPVPSQILFGRCNGYLDREYDR
jgi:hypothetical protein